MKERNNILPFPGKERFLTHLELENYLLDAKDGVIFDYEDLPETITSSAIENYGNWLAELTQKDPEHWERGAIIHYNNRKRDFVFPSNPQIGRDEVYSFFSKNPLFNTPVVATHSHPSNDCFSFWHHGDLAFFLDKIDEESQHPYVPVSLVATTEDNFLLIKAKETPEMDTYQGNWGYEILRDWNYDPDVKEIRNFHSLENQYGIGLPKEEIKRLFFRAGVSLTCPVSSDRFFGYYCLFFQNYFAAKIYKYGFYYSRKDGLYKRFSKEELKSYLTEVIRERFLRAKMNE